MGWPGQEFAACTCLPQLSSRQSSASWPSPWEGWGGGGWWWLAICEPLVALSLCGRERGVRIHPSPPTLHPLCYP